MSKRSRGYAPFACSEFQDGILDLAVAQVDSDSVAVFDLDGCLFDTRFRQVAIFKEFAATHGALELFHVDVTHFQDWDLRNTLKRLRVSTERIEHLYPSLREFWWKRFFSDTYVRMDHAMPGAVELVKACYKKGAHVVYLTGRDNTMRKGTEDSLVAFGFPYQLSKTLLMTKPEFSMDDTQYKEAALNDIRQLGIPKLFVDNEPSNCNRFVDCCPDALVLFFETDHSPRPDVPHPDLYWLRSFFKRDWHGEGWKEYEELPLVVRDYSKKV